jgi:hypothetical protein
MHLAWLEEDYFDNVEGAYNLILDAVQSSPNSIEVFLYHCQHTDLSLALLYFDITAVHSTAVCSVFRNYSWLS